MYLQGILFSSESNNFPQNFASVWSFSYCLQGSIKTLSLARISVCHSSFSYRAKHVKHVSKYDFTLLFTHLRLLRTKIDQ